MAYMPTYEQQATSLTGTRTAFSFYIWIIDRDLGIDMSTRHKNAACVSVGPVWHSQDRTSFQNIPLARPSYQQRSYLAKDRRAPHHLAEGAEVGGGNQQQRQKL